LISSDDACQPKLGQWPRVVAHADMDAFYASAEQLDDPALRSRAIIVGPNSLRGVVLTASYEARAFGVKSAMPMANAMRLCPDAIVVPPRFERYQALSESIMRAFSDFSPNVEAISLDEAFIDMSGAHDLFGSPRCIAEQIQAAVYDVTQGLTASVGIASTKYVAKVASDFNKPNGLTVVPPEEAVQWLDTMPVSRLWGAGPKTVPRLEQLGLYTIGDVRRADTAYLRQRLGSMGLHFQSLSRAEDPRRVSRRRVARSMGSDRTLLKDVNSRSDIEQYIKRSADRIGRRLRDKGYRAYGVRVKLKTNRFELQSRQARLPVSTHCSDKLYSVGIKLLNQFDRLGSYRLVGLAAYDLVHIDEPLQLDLFNRQHKTQALEYTLDKVIDRYGSGAVLRAADLGRSRTIADITPNLDFTDDIA